MFGNSTRRSFSWRRIPRRNATLMVERLEERSLLAALAEFQIRLLPPDAPTTTADLTQVSVGQQYDLVVSVQDLRTPSSSTSGVFAAYMDIGYDSTKTKVQMAEIHSLSIGPFTTANPHTAATGTFSLSAGGHSTGAIAFTSSTALAPAIEGALSSIEGIGAGNVRVIAHPVSISSSYLLTFEIHFVGDLLDKDVPNLIVASQNIAGGSSAVVSVTHDGDLQSVTGRKHAYREAFRSRMQPAYFQNGLSAEDMPNLINDVGAFASIQPTGVQAQELVRARLKATDAGTVTFTPDVVNVLKPVHQTVMYSAPGVPPVLQPDQIAIVSKTLTVLGAVPIGVNPDVVTVAEDSGATVIDVLANDTPAGALQIDTVTQPANGTVTFTADNVAYTPAPNFVGTDSFTYTARAAATGASVTGTVTVTVTSVNDPPQFIKGPSVTTTDDAVIVVVHGWATAIAAGPANEAAQALTFEVTIDKPELFDDQYVTVNAQGDMVFLPAPNVSGIATVTVVLRDNGGGLDSSAPQTFTIEITRPYQWKNSKFPVNVDGSDGENPVSAIDAVLVINYLNNVGGGPVPTDALDKPPYLDVNGDDFVSPIDAVEVINHLNSMANPPASGSAALSIAAPSSSLTASEGSSADRDALFLALAADLPNSSATRRRKMS